MKILICSLQVSSEGAKGHFTPALEIAIQAKKSGHDVVLLPLPSSLGSDDAKLCNDFGIRLVVTPELPVGIIKSKDELASLASDNTKTHLAFKSFLIDPLNYQMEPLQKIIELEKPDVIINDLLLYLPTIISNKLKIKNYGYCAGFKLLADEKLSVRYKDYYKLLLPEIDNFLTSRQSSITLKNLECLTSDGNFVFFPPDLGVLNNDDRVKCIGSLPNSLEPLDLSVCDNTKSYAVLSFGSVLDPFDYPEITQNIVKLCEEEDLHLFISTKRNIENENITAMSYLPIHRLLRRASLYFHHGGANSFNEASRVGTPQVLIAMTTDQPIQANLLKKLGHGFALDREKISYKELKEVIAKFKDSNSIVNKKRIEIEKEFNSTNGAESIIQEIERESYTDNIYGESVSGRDVYFPKNSEDVQRIIKNANSLKEKIYPISSAKSYGMGTKINQGFNSTYIDLKYLKQISNYDERSGTIEIETGVTQKELSAYLEGVGSLYTVNVTGSSEDSSIVANITDRGIGHFNEREKDLISLRLVSGGGDIIETGGNVYKDSQVSSLYSSGLGPNLNFVFLQSSFGIVTSAVIKLVPKRDTTIINMSVGSKETLSKLIPKLDDMIRRGILTEGLHISNKNRKESVLIPLEARQSNTSFETARKENSIEGEYFVTSSIRIDSRLMGAFKKVIEEELAQLCIINFSSKLEFEAQSNEYLRGVFNHSFGIPSDDAILSLGYEFNRIINPKRLEREGIGTFFLVPLIPFEEEKLEEVISIVDEIFGQYHFIPYMTFNSISNNCFEGVINLNFDNTNLKRAKLAKDTMIKVFNEFNSRGFSPQRISVFQKKYFFGVKPAHKQVVSKLKQVFDPNEVIVGVKYEF